MEIVKPISVPSEIMDYLISSKTCDQPIGDKYNAKLKYYWELFLLIIMNMKSEVKENYVM